MRPLKVIYLISLPAVIRGLLLCLISFESFGQTIPKDKAVLRLKLTPQFKQIVYLSDSTKVFNGNDYLLDTGLWTLKMWEPGYDLFDTAFTLSNKQVLTLKSVLVMTPEHAEYKKEFGKYFTNKMAYIVVGAAPVVVALLFTNQHFNQYRDKQNKMNSYYEQMSIAKVTYENTNDYFEFNNSEFNFRNFEKLYLETKKERNDLWKGYALKLSATSLSAVLFYSLVKIPKAPKKPSYKNPLANSSLYLELIPNGLCFTASKTF